MRLIDPSFRFHLRCAVGIGLSVAFVLVIGFVWWGSERYGAFINEQRGFHADARRLQEQLNRQVGELRAERAGDVAEIQERFRAISDWQSNEESAAHAVASKAPFSIETVLPAIVELVCIDDATAGTYYTGSGTVIEPGGLLVTNRHLLVAKDGSIIRYCGIGFTSDLHLAPKIEFIATVVATREDDDLALLKITDRVDEQAMPKSFPFLSIVGAKEASLDLGIGDPIFIGGYPGLGAETFTFTQGVVSGRVGDRLIKTSALIDSGASGGAAFDSSGAYVGIPTAAAKGDIGGSLGYVVGANAVTSFVEDYLAASEQPVTVPAAAVKKP